VVFEVIVGLACAFHGVVVLRMARSMRAVPELAELSPPDPARWPRVSVIVPACNEEPTLERAARSRLADDYPELEIVLVDDRSVDGTGAVVDRLAAEDPRVLALHVTELPPGWLGKLNALHQGVARARGEWLLFSDADIHFRAGTLRKAVALAEARGLDHVVLMARIVASTPLTDAAVNALLGALGATVDFSKLDDPRSRHAIGSGIFSLVRRSTFDRTRGFEWLRLEVVDDLALGQMLKDAGARQTMVNARSGLTLDWYRSVEHMARSLEKNGFALVGRYRVGMLALTLAVTLPLTLGPYAGAAVGGAPWVRPTCLATLAVALGTYALFNRWLGRRAWTALLAPVGSLLMAYFVVRAAAMALARGGVEWRGTRYPTRQLRENMRFRFP